MKVRVDSIKDIEFNGFYCVQGNLLELNRMKNRHTRIGAASPLNHVLQSFFYRSAGSRHRARLWRTAFDGQHIRFTFQPGTMQIDIVKPECHLWKP